MKVKSLTEDKEQTRLKSEELVATCEQLQSEVSSTNTRIISQKVTIQVSAAFVSQIQKD